jgi:DNA-binding NtrC family response regulator
MSGKILVVDDELSVIKALKRSLDNESYEIFTATSAEDALSIMEAEEFDVIISDERMPGMSGTNLLTVVSQNYPDTVRIMLTGYPNMDTALKAINSGDIFRFLTKPWNEIDLEVTIRQAMYQREVLKRGRNHMLADMKVIEHEEGNKDQEIKAEASFRPIKDDEKKLVDQVQNGLLSLALSENHAESGHEPVFNSPPLDTPKLFVPGKHK